MTIWQQHRQYAEEMAMNGPHRGGDGRLEIQLLQVSL